MGDKGFGGMVAFTSGGTGSALFARAVSVSAERAPAYALVIDLPVEAMVVDRLGEATDIEVLNLRSRLAVAAPEPLKQRSASTIRRK